MTSVTGMMTRAAVTPKEGHGTHLATSWQGTKKIQVSDCRELLICCSVGSVPECHLPDRRDSDRVYVLMQVIEVPKPTITEDVSHQPVSPTSAVLELSCLW